MIHRSLAMLGLLALVLGACHGNGPPATMMPDPMNPMSYRGAPSGHERGNRSATRAAIAACTSATLMHSTPSECARAR